MTSIGIEHEEVLGLPGGRRLSYATYGAPAGPLVVVLDGPGSRGLARAAAPVAAELGIRLAAPDRPGFGRSTPDPRRAITDWPADHAALLAALGAQRAGILGQSGGTPFALAAAAALPQRTTGVALLGGLAPLDDPGGLKEAGRQLRTGAKLARRAPWLLRLGLRAAARQARKDPEKAAAKVAGDLPPADAEILRDRALWDLHVRATREILSRPGAVADEIGLVARPWGVALEDVRAPVALWTGDRDTTHPVAHARRLAARLHDAPVHVVPGAATFGLLPIVGDALRVATRGEPRSAAAGSGASPRARAR
jgi:pimeloyl-ACP methyl ester carboxylesterase